MHGRYLRQVSQCPEIFSLQLGEEKTCLCGAINAFFFSCKLAFLFWDIGTHTHIFNQNNYLSVPILSQSCPKTSLLSQTIAHKQGMYPSLWANCHFDISAVILTIWARPLSSPLKSGHFCLFFKQLCPEMSFCDICLFHTFCTTFVILHCLISFVTLRRVPRIQPLLP